MAKKVDSEALEGLIAASGLDDAAAARLREANESPDKPKRPRGHGAPVQAMRSVMDR